MTERAASSSGEGACDGGQPVRDGAPGASLTQPAVAEASTVAVSPDTHTGRHVPASRRALSEKGWTPEHDEILRAMWPDPRVSSPMIGERLRRSKDSVIGRAHRLGLGPKPIDAAAFQVLTPAVIAIRDADAERLRAAVAEGRTVLAAATAIGMPTHRAKMLARLFKIKASPEALRQASIKRKRVARATARIEREKHAAIAPPNPRLTAAQNANIARGKNVIRAMYSAMGRGKVAPPSRDEAERLIAEHIARHGVTVCPPAASPEKPINAGLGWGRGR